MYITNLQYTLLNIENNFFFARKFQLAQLVIFYIIVLQVLKNVPKKIV